MKAYLGLGTNIGDRLKNLTSAVKALNYLPGTEAVKISSVYETEPWGYTEQATFYNICVEVETDLSPAALLGACLGIEAAMGRERPFRYSPRIIDIDVLLYEGAMSDTPELKLPHPLISERSFVLIPLKEVLPSMSLNNSDFENAYELCDKKGVNKVCEIEF